MLPRPAILIRTGEWRNYRVPAYIETCRKDAPHFLPPICVHETAVCSMQCIQQCRLCETRRRLVGRRRQRISVRMQSSQLARNRWLGERTKSCSRSIYRAPNEMHAHMFSWVGYWGKTRQDRARLTFCLGFSIVFVCWKDTKEELIYAVLRKFATVL